VSLIRSAPLPEEIELEKKLRVVDRLKDRLADSEESLATFQAELDQFEARYKIEVGRLYADLDEIEAEIAEEEAKLVPDDEEIKKKAEELRRKAEESAKAAAATSEVERSEPTPEARKAYHDLARAIHPDLTLDPEEKERRHKLMSRLNEAYSSGDSRALEELAADHRVSPDAVAGDSVADALVRAVRQIAQINARLSAIRTERAKAEKSELYSLFLKVNDEAAEGRDLLRHMANRTSTHIRKAKRRLENLMRVNAAAAEHVRETYGLNITDFQKN
jgi:hypothetical protein